MTDTELRMQVMEAGDLLAEMIHGRHAGHIALVSSFGAESAVLLHLAAGIERRLPVLFLDTGKLFGETLRYYESLSKQLGLSDVRRLRPDPLAVTTNDPNGVLWSTDADRCCHVRKVAPLIGALDGFDAWITGRKRYQGGDRGQLPVVEERDGRVKINPLAGWTRENIGAYFAVYDLPRHPLEADGYRSIGCMPCTSRSSAEEDPRAGRWRFGAKTECGIHTQELAKRVA